jgi:hypothetical protein
MIFKKGAGIISVFVTIGMIFAYLANQNNKPILIDRPVVKTPVVKNVTNTGSWAKLTKDEKPGSVKLYQSVNTPDGPYDVTFDYYFTTKTGVLDVLLNSVVVGILRAEDEKTGESASFRSMITDKDLLGAKGLIFSLNLSGPSGSEILITNISIKPI